VCVTYSLSLSFEEVVERDVPKPSTLCCGLCPFSERFEETALGAKAGHLATESLQLRRDSDLHTELYLEAC